MMRLPEKAQFFKCAIFQNNNEIFFNKGNEEKPQKTKSQFFFLFWGYLGLIRYSQAKYSI